MATNFNVPVDKTNDPSYLGYSRGTDNASLQPLAGVPELNTKYVQPDYKANTSFGKLFEGLGQVGTDAVKFADDIIKDNINKDVSKGVSAIRDSFGVAAAAENADLARSVGQAGADGAPTNINPNGGGGPLIPQDKNQPLPLQRLGTRLEGLKEQYAQGNLSDSAYYAKQEAFVREVKARYPGYEDQVDKIVENKLGVNPANATRKAIQNDVEKLANKVQAQNDKWTNWERQNGGSISRLYGGFENYQKGRADGSITKTSVEARVANLNAKEEGEKAAMTNIALSNADRGLQGSQAKDVATVGATSVVDQTYNNVVAGFNITNFNELADSIRSGKRPLPSPDERPVMLGQFSLLEQKTNAALDNYFDKPVFDAAGHTTTRRALIGDQSVIDNIKKGATAKIDGLKKVIFGNEAPSIFQYESTLSAARQESANTSVYNALPNLLNEKAVRDKVGDDMTYMLYSTQPKINEARTKGIAELNWGQIANGGYTISKSLEDARRSGINDGDLNKRMIEDTKKFIQHPELLRDRSVQSNAVEHLFGGSDNQLLTQKVLAAGGRQAATTFFTSVTDDKTVKAISKMDNEHKTMFVSWAEGAWPTVYQTEAENANQSAKTNTERNSLKLNFDPSAGKFYYTGQYLSASGIVNRSNATLDGFNAAIQSMKRVWDMNGETDVVAKLYQYLPVAGIEPGTPIYKLIREEYDKASAKAETK